MVAVRYKDQLDLIITKAKKKKRVIILGIVGAIVFLALVASVVVVLTTTSWPSNEYPEENESVLSLQDFLDGKLNPKGFNASWVSGDTLLYRAEDGSLVLYNVKDQSKEEVLSYTSAALKTGFDHQLSPDKKYLLIGHDYQKLYRHTYLARYTVVELSSKREIPVGAEEVTLHYASWGPEGNSIVYVWNNDIYYQADAVSTGVAITNDGKEGHVYNGIPDWVYEEEVFGSNHALWFSPDGKKLAYVKFNDNTTNIMTIPYYGIPGSLDSQYTRAVQIRYPK
ncbi:hypothetical protein Trydic_g15447, partial [Trypoxylus dichotomus]